MQTQPRKLLPERKLLMWVRLGSQAGLLGYQGLRCRVKGAVCSKNLGLAAEIGQEMGVGFFNHLRHVPHLSKGVTTPVHSGPRRLRGSGADRKPGCILFSSSGPPFLLHVLQLFAPVRIPQERPLFSRVSGRSPVQSEVRLSRGAISARNPLYFSGTNS